MKIIVFAAVAVMIGLTIAGCGQQVTSDSANHDMTPSKLGLSKAQIQQDFNQAMASRSKQAPSRAAAAAAAAGAKGAAPATAPATAAQ
jgi:hypothetical protein